MATNLSQYYKQKGLALPSINERKTIAAKAGISNYSGSIGQNAQLLDFLTGQVGPTSSVIRTPTSISSTNTNISRVDDVSIVPNPVITAPTTPIPTLVAPETTLTVIKTVDNTDGTSTNFLSDGTTDTGVYSKNVDGTLKFNPISSDPLQADITRTESEIQTIESRMANRTADRNTALGGAGVFTDMKRLNELNATLRAAQDRRIEVPIESRQNLRGRGATISELAGESVLGLEQAALQELTASRQSSRLTDTVNTNIALVNSFIAAETERDNVLFTQKNRYLTKLQTNYSNIITAKQALALEERKFQNDSQKEQLGWDRKLKESTLEAAIANGATPEQIQKIINGTASDAIVLNSQLTGNIKADSAQGVVTQVNAILNAPGFDGGVGTNFLGRISISGDAQEFKGLVDQLLSQKTLDSISELKAKGVSLGALSDSELSILAGAALPIRRNKNGGITMKEEAFKNIMNTVKSVAQKTFIASIIGKTAYDAGNFKNAAPEVLAAKYDELVVAQAPATNAFSSDFGGTVSLNTTPSTAGNLPQRNNNPGNVKRGGLADSLATGTDSQGHLIFPDAAAGFTALALDLNAKISGKSRFLPANPTIAQLGKVYAEDGGWANSVSKLLGVPTSTPTATIPLDKLLVAVARQEGFYAA